MEAQQRRPVINRCYRCPGRFDRRLGRVREIYHARRDVLAAEAELAFGPGRLHGLAAGCHALLRLPDGTSELLDRLKALPESPWADYNGGAGLTAMKLGVLLKEYEITSRTIRFPAPIGQAKGFHRGAFIDAWERYCPPEDEPASEPYQPYQDDLSAAQPPVRLLRPVRLEPYHDHDDNEAGTA